MKTYFGFLGGANFVCAIYSAAFGYAWLAVVQALVAALMLYIASQK